MTYFARFSDGRGARMRVQLSTPFLPAKFEVGQRMQVRLIRKLADNLDGIDVSGHAEGDELTLPPAQAQLLIAEHWAAPLTPAPENEVRGFSAGQPSRVAADRFPRLLSTSAIERLRAIRNRIASGRFEPHENRRAEDHIREELRDSRARTVKRVR